MKSPSWILCLLGCAFFAAPLAAVEKPAPPRIDIILWFDTEDYLLPADDDACKRLAEMLTQRNIRATFKIVGEKARVLEARGRQDVIAALKAHDIGYHSNFHSVHPTPSEYLAECGMRDGMAEFVRREGQGAADVQRILGVKTLSCYGQPGSSWGSQAVAALKEIGVAPSGVPCYVDEGSQVGLNRKPFWFAGALNVFNMGRADGYTRMELHDPEALEPAKKEASDMAARLLKANGGGIISIFYHPCEWVHQQFWDGVNFSAGANPPRKAWRAPLQRTPEETEGAFLRFGQYLDHLLTIPGVRFVCASDLPGIYPDTVRTEGATGEDLAILVSQILKPDSAGLDFQVIGKRAYSLADQFELLTLAVADLGEGNKVKFPLKAGGLLGPDNAPPAAFADARAVERQAFFGAVLDARDFLRSERRVPSRVFIGADAMAPADFLKSLAFAYDAGLTNGALSQGGDIPLGSGALVLPVRHIAEDTPKLFGSWVIHKPGFRAPKILEVARLQTWTLKPAVRRE